MRSTLFNLFLFLCLTIILLGSILLCKELNAMRNDKAKPVSNDNILFVKKLS